MNALGWIMMLASWTVILCIAGFCLWRVLVVRPENIHAPLDIDTGDLDGTTTAHGARR